MPPSQYHQYLDLQATPIISSQFPDVVIPLVDKAVSSVDILVYDWRFYQSEPANPVSQFNLALMSARKRGVKIRCLVNFDASVNILRSLGFEAFTLPSSKLLHVKLMIIDGVKIITGSHNYTQNAFTSNHELSVYFSLSDADNDFVKYFNNLYGI